MTTFNFPRTVLRRLFVAVVAAAAGLAPLLVAPAASAHPRPLPDSYQLTGDAGGSRFEGIGYDRRSAAFYVSETTGGEIHRGQVRRSATQEWLPGDGSDGRWTARGITVDQRGRVYVAGGPNSTDHPGAPDLWVYSRSGRLIAALRTGLPGVFLNDVAIGPDGAAYFTDSNTPRIFRVARDRSGWSVSVWKDASGPVTQASGFNFNGIVATPDGRALLVVQSNAGKLWRFDFRTRAVLEVSVGAADLTSGDGLVLNGDELTVVRNFPRRLVTLDLNRSWREARQVADVQTAADRVFTTAKIAKGRLLAVDSKFDEATPAPPYEVVVLPLP